jgi:hypothetical protein
MQGWLLQIQGMTNASTTKVTKKLEGECFVVVGQDARRTGGWEPALRFHYFLEGGLEF